MESSPTTATNPSLLEKTSLKSYKLNNYLRRHAVEMYASAAKMHFVSL